MALDLEYLEEAVVEAAAATEWYATRSTTAAAGFETELAEAESAIRMLPNAALGRRQHSQQCHDNH